MMNNGLKNDAIRKNRNVDTGYFSLFFKEKA